MKKYVATPLSNTDCLSVIVPFLTVEAVGAFSQTSKENHTLMTFHLWQRVAKWINEDPLNISDQGQHVLLSFLSNQLFEHTEQGVLSQLLDQCSLEALLRWINAPIKHGDAALNTFFSRIKVGIKEGYEDKTVRVGGTDVTFSMRKNPVTFFAKMTLPLSFGEHLYLRHAVKKGASALLFVSKPVQNGYPEYFSLNAINASQNPKNLYNVMNAITLGFERDLNIQLRKAFASINKASE